MKIAIPVDENKETTAVCFSYGRCPYFMVYDTTSKTVSYLDNSANAELGGAGIKASQMIVDSGAEIVLTQRLGENAAEVLKQGGIEIYKTISPLAKDGVSDFQGGKLSVLTDIHPGFHGHN